MGEKAFDEWLSQQKPITDSDVPTRGDEVAAEAQQSLWDRINNIGKGTALEAGARAFNHSFMSGGADEATAGLRSLVGGEGYEQGLEEERRLDQELRTDHPISSFIGDVGGSAAQMLLPIGRVGAAVEKVAPPIYNAGKSLLSRFTQPATTVKEAVVKGAGTSGAQSTMLGFGEGEGGFLPRLQQAAATGALGAVLGGGVGGTGAAVTKGAKTVKNASFQKAGAELKKITDDAYKAADQAGFVFNGNDINQSLTQAMNEVRTNSGYWAPEVYPDDAQLDKFMDKVLADTQSQTTTGGLKPRDMTFAELEQMRKGLKQKMKQTKDPRMMALIRAVDNVIDTNAQASELAQAARNASRVQRNTAVFDELVRKADLNSAANNTNRASALRRTAAKMMTDPNTAPFLEPEEMTILESVVRPGGTGKLESFLSRYDPSSSHFASMASAMWLLQHPIAGTAIAGVGYGARKAGEQSTDAAIAQARNVISGSNVSPPVLTAGQGPLAKGLVAQTSNRMSPLMEGILQNNLMNGLLGMGPEQPQGAEDLPTWDYDL